MNVIFQIDCLCIEETEWEHEIYRIIYTKLRECDKNIKNLLQNSLTHVLIIHKIDFQKLLLFFLKEKQTT